MAVALEPSLSVLGFSTNTWDGGVLYHNIFFDFVGNLSIAGMLWKMDGVL